MGSGCVAVWPLFFLEGRDPFLRYPVGIVRAVPGLVSFWVFRDVLFQDVASKYYLQNPSRISALGAKYPHLRFSRVNKLHIPELLIVTSPSPKGGSEKGDPTKTTLKVTENSILSPLKVTFCSDPPFWIPPFGGR